MRFWVGVLLGALLAVGFRWDRRCPAAPECDAACAEKIRAGCYLGAREICTSSGCVPLPVTVVSARAARRGVFGVQAEARVEVDDGAGVRHVLSRPSDVACVVQYIRETRPDGHGTPDPRWADHV